MLGEERLYPNDPEGFDALIKENAGSPGRMKVYEGVGVAKLAAALVGEEGRPVILSNIGDLHEREIFFRAGHELDSELLEAHIEAIKADQRVFHLQVQARTVSDLVNFRDRLAQNLGHIGGYGDIENELLNPEYEEGLAGPAKVILSEDEGEIGGFVARFNIPIAI